MPGAFGSAGAPEHSDEVHFAAGGVRERDGGVGGGADADEHALAAGAGAADARPAPGWVDGRVCE